MRTVHVGPDELLVAIKLEFAGLLTVEQVAAQINETEHRIRAAVPSATYIYLEPDVYQRDYRRDAAPDGGP